MSIFDKFIYLIAGCRKEAEDYARLYALPLNKMVFIDRLGQMHGMPHDSVVWACGQYADLKEWPEIEKQLRARGIKTIYRI